jgi:hypothetical protein
LTSRAIREKYGFALFGQGCLAAWRLVGAGVRVVTVYWDEFGPANTGWDTHTNNFPRLKEGLCPTFDQALTAFLDDLEQRDLLHETLVLMMSEHGRTPKLANVSGGGRDHWSFTYYTLRAEVGVKRGTVVGATDRQGGYPIDRDQPKGHAGDHVPPARLRSKRGDDRGTRGKANVFVAVWQGGARGAWVGALSPRPRLA